MKILLLYTFFIIVFTGFVLGENISISYPTAVNYSQNFTINITLENFTIDLYDIKIDIKNSSGSTITDFWNGTGWRSTYYYYSDALNNSVSNSSLFLLNLTEKYNGTASINISIRSTSGTITIFTGFFMNVSNFSSAVTCTASYSCGSWSSCSSGNQTRSCTNTSSSCVITTVTERRSCTSSSSSSSSDDEEIYLELEDYDKIKIGEEKEITINAYNLESKKYDIKLYVHYVDSDSAISETYNLSQWTSGKYYAEGVLEGSGDKTVALKIRMESDAHLDEDTEITAKIREFDSSTVISEIVESITISEASEIKVSNSVTASTKNETIINTNSTLSLNSVEDKEDKIIYESKGEIIKKYAIFGFVGFLILVIVFLLIKM